MVTAGQPLLELVGNSNVVQGMVINDMPTDTVAFRVTGDDSGT